MAVPTTGPDFHEDHVLADGTKVRLRHIRPDDGAELRRSFERLSPESRYRRFLTGMTSLSDHMIRYLTCVDGQDHVAIVAVTHPPGSAEEVGVGVARFIRTTDDPAAAEVAIAVVDDMQHKGLGRILALTLARAAHERAVDRFRGEILDDNLPVRTLLDEVGATVRALPDGSKAFEVPLDFATEGARARLDLVARRILRAAASVLPGVMRRLRLGAGSKLRDAVRLQRE
jgi:hypothetical protein